MIENVDLQAVISLRHELHNSPEPSGHEENTRRLLMNFLKTHTATLAICDMQTWFYAFKKGSGSRAPIAFRADHDAVTCADGRARHLCGHDGHSAVLAGFAMWLDKKQLDRDVYLIFQPAEENGKGAAICSSLIDEKGIAEIYGFHNIPGYPVGSVILLNHTFACASTGLEIRFSGKQSHAAYPESGANPARAIAKTIIRMDEIVRESHKGIVLGTLIGIDAGSASYGVSAGEGTLRLTLRAEYQDEYDMLVQSIEDTASRLAASDNLTCAMTRIEEFPATINDADCVRKLADVARALGRPTVTPPEPFRWSEDFGHYLSKTRGAFLGIGCGEGHAALHTMEYEFLDEVIEVGVGVFAGVAGR